MEAMKIAEIAERKPYAWTACLLGDPVGCGGITISDEGLGQVWSVLSPVIKRFPVQLFKMVKKGIDEAVASGQCKGLQVRIDEHDERAIRFIEHLGFPREKRAYLYERAV